MQKEIISILKKYKLEINKFKINQIDYDENSEIIKRFNNDLKKIKELDDLLISKVTNGMNNWEKISVSDNKKYIGELSDKKPDGIGILLKVEKGYFGGENIEYIGYFKKGEIEGFGRKYGKYRKYGIFKDLEYLGFFRNNLYEGFGLSVYGQAIYYVGYFNEGKYNNYGKQFHSKKLYYQGYFIRDKHHGKGIIYYENEKIYISGIFNDNLIDGISYDPKGNKIYKGIFINENPKEGKSLRIYEKDGELKYEGDFLEGNYDGYGILYGKGNITGYKLKMYEGKFKKGKYHGLGKKYEDNYLFIAFFYLYRIYMKILENTFRKLFIL